MDKYVNSKEIFLAFLGDNCTDMQPIADAIDYTPTYNVITRECQVFTGNSLFDCDALPPKDFARVCDCQPLGM